MSTFNISEIEQSSDDGPVTMLNLVKYRDRALDGVGSGREAYQRYTQKAQDYVEARGGRVLWAGIVAEAGLQDGLTDDSVDWDWALLVCYPNRAAFVDMVTSPEYLAANKHRTNGLSKHAILACRTLLPTYRLMPAYVMITRQYRDVHAAICTATAPDVIAVVCGTGIKP